MNRKHLFSAAAGIVAALLLPKRSEGWQEMESITPPVRWPAPPPDPPNSIRLGPMTPEQVREATMAAVEPSTAVYAFAAWLTCRDDRTVLSAHDNAAPAAELADRFCKAQGWQEPHSFDRLKTYPEA